MKTIASIFGWVCIISIVVAAIFEPNQPKRDGRFKTGFKDNATPRKKTSEDVMAQRVALGAAIVSGLLWNYLK